MIRSAGRLERSARDGDGDGGVYRKEGKKDESSANLRFLVGSVGVPGTRRARTTF